MSLVKKYESIDQSKLKPAVRDILKKMKDKSENFTNAEINKKVEPALDKLLVRLEKELPEAIKKPTKKVSKPKKEVKAKATKKRVTKKTTKKATKKATQTKTTKPKKEGAKEHISTRASKLAKKEGITFKEARARLSKEAKEKEKKETKTALDELQKLISSTEFQKDLTKFPKKNKGGKRKLDTDLERDAKIPAKPRGKRTSKSGKTYYEYRDNRSDVRQSGYPYLADGGAIDSLKKDMNSKLDIHSEYYVNGGQVDYRGYVTNDVVEDIIKANGLNVQIEENWLNGYEIFAKKLELEKVKSLLNEYNIKSEFVQTQGFGLNKLKVPSQIIEYAKGGKIEVGKKYSATFSNKFKKRVPTKFEVISKFKGRDNMPMVEILTEDGSRANVFEKDLKTLMFAKGGSIDGFTLNTVKGVVNKPTEMLLEDVTIDYEFGGEVDYEVYNLKDRLIDLGDDDFVNWAEKNNQNPSLLKYEFIDRLTDYHGEEYAKGGRLKVYDESYDEPIKTFNSFEKAKKWVLANHKKFDEITIEDAYLDTIVVDKTDTKDDIEFLFSDNMAKGGRTISIVNDGVKYDKSKYKAIYGDFDNDGTVNIDDANPLDSSKKGRVEQIELRNTFDKLLNVKAELDTIMYDAVETLDEKAPKDADIYARTKTPYSIIKKLVEKRMLDPKKGLTDMIGTTIAVKNQKELEQVRDDIDGGLLGKVLDRDDFYKTPNAGYMAYHYIVDYQGVPVEVQLKTKNMKKLHEVSHEAYKNGTLNAKSLDSLSKTFMRADKGDAKAKSEISELLKDKKLLASKISKGSMAKGGETKEFNQIKKDGLDKLGLNQRTEFIDVERGIGSNLLTFRLRRINVLDNKRKYPNRKYYFDDIADEIYFVENGTLHKQFLDGNLKEHKFSIPRAKLTYGKYAKGGEVLEYSKILDILTDKIDDAVEDIETTYEQATNTKGEEVESKSRDGFIPYTNGGYSSRWFEYGNMLEGSGMNLPTESLDNKIEEFRERNKEYGFERFEEEYPEIVKELGGIENVNYSELEDAGYSNEADDLDMFMEDDEDSIMMEVEAFYYTPFNDRGEDGKHTIQLSGAVNLEAPYHRSGNLEDYIEERFTFDSYKELEDKLDKGLAKVVSWFEGDMYDKNPRELKIRRMEAGGTLPTPFGQAGLVGETGAMNEVDLFDMGGDLPQGVHQYYANTYNPAYPTPHGYAKGGEIDENKAHYSINQDYQIYVDSNFINMSQNALPNSKLKHYGFGEFYLETPNGNIEFIRTDFKIKGFVGRTHRLGGNPNVGLDLLDAMKSKSQQVSGERFAKGGEITVEIVDNFDEQVGYIKGTPLNVVEVDEDDYMITSDGRFLSVGEVEFADQKSKENYYKIINSRLAKGGKVGRYTRDDLPNFLDKIFNKDFIENVSIQKDQMDINFKDDGFIVGEKDIKAVEKKGWTFDSLSTYGTSGISLLFTRKSFAKGGKTQGYNDKLDESLGNRDGVEPMMMQSYKDRRDESKGMEKAMGRRAYQSVGTMDNMAKGGYVYRESDDEDATEFLNKKEVMELIEEHNKSFDTNYKTIESFNKGEQKANGIRSIEKMAKGGKTQGYNDKLDESLGNRNSVEPLIMQSYKDRRDESKAMEKAMGRRAYQSVGTMDKMGKGGIYTVYKDKGYVVVDIHKKDGDYVFLSYPRTKRMANFISKRLKRKKGANQFERKIISFKEAKAQGYGDKLDESLGYRKGKASTKKQNYKDRRNESEAMEKKGGKRKYASVKTMDKGNRRKRKTPMSLAKEIRKEGEKWQDAVKRASAMLKKK